MSAGVMARENLEQLLDESSRAEAEVNQLKAANQELTAQLAAEKAKNQKLRVFESIAENPPKVVMVYINDPKLCEKLVGTAVKYHGDALGNPEHSEDEQTRKRARGHVQDIVIACVRFGLERFSDVHAKFMSYT
jgi:hypothetical protein